MRVLLYLPTPGGLTGAPRRLLTLTRGLTRLGMIPVIATESESELYRAAQSDDLAIIDLDPPDILKLRGGVLFGGGALFRARVMFGLLRQQFRFLKAVHTSGADVIWIRASKGIAFAGLGVLLSRKALVWDIDFELPSRGVVRILHRLGLWLATYVVFQHDAAPEIFGKDLADRYRSKMRVLLPGIELEPLKAHRDAHPKSGPRSSEMFDILQVGSICDRKNQSFLIEVLDRLPADLRGRVRLSLVGGSQQPEYDRELRHRLSVCGLEENVVFLGWRDDVHALMCNSDLLVMPSKDEGVPNAVQEAMALGLPVLGSDRGGIPEVLDHEKTGWVLPIDDPARWAETIGRLINAPETLARVGESARIHAETHFANDAWCARYLQVFEEALASRKGRGSV